MRRRSGHRCGPARVALLSVLALAGCSRPHRDGPPNVVLITIDTLRADRLGAYGCTAETSPAIDAFAHDATVFDVAVPTCPATAPSVASILTGHHRNTHRVMGNGWAMAGDVETLADLLHAGGYRTIARVANLTLDPNAGFAKGFDDYAIPAALERTGPGMLEGAPLVADVTQLLDTLGDGPFFLWIHLMDPHGPYFPPQRVRDAFPPERYRWPGEDTLRVSPTNFGLGIIPAYQLVETRASAADYRARYDAEVRYADEHVGALVAALRAHGLWDDAVVVLTADHGESLGEHDYFFQHGWYAYEETLHVPLLIRAPGRLPPGRRVTASVSLVDLAPTILELAGRPAATGMEGHSLLPVVEQNEGDRPAFAQTYYGEGSVAVRLGAFKYVFKPARTTTAPRPATDPPWPDDAREELFDLAHDPHETTNLIETRPDVARGLRAQVHDWLADQERRGRGQAARQNVDGKTRSVLGDPQVQQQLRALGYIE